MNRYVSLCIFGNFVSLNFAERPLSDYIALGSCMLHCITYVYAAVVLGWKPADNHQNFDPSLLLKTL